MDQDYLELSRGKKYRLMTIMFELNINDSRYLLSVRENRLGSTEVRTPSLHNNVFNLFME